MNGEQIIWMMDSEFCCKCGAALDYFESTLCTFCYEEQGRDEERALYDDEDDYYDGWGSDWDVPIEEQGKP